MAVAFVPVVAGPPATLTSANFRGAAALSPSRPSAPALQECAWTASAVGAAAAAGAALVGAAARSAKAGKRRARVSGQARDRSMAAVAAAARPDERQEAPAISRAEALRSLGCLAALAPASAQAKSLEEAGKELKTLGTPEIVPLTLQDGFSQHVETIGLLKQSNLGRVSMGNKPQVITFACPGNWIVSRPKLDFNGSSGTVQVSDYTKGDSAVLYRGYSQDKNKPYELKNMSKKDFTDVVKQALTLKGKGSLDDFNMMVAEDSNVPGYKWLEYKYRVESGSGIPIDRHGYAHVTQTTADGPVICWWVAVIDFRYAEQKNNIIEVARSFRITDIPADNVVKPNMSMKDGREEDLENYNKNYTSL